MAQRNLLFGMSLFTATGIVLYWTTVFAGWFPVVELVPGYREWFLSFPLADAWIAVVAAATAFSVWQKCEETALFGALTGSGLIFLGLYAFAYGVNTGLIYQPTIDETIEIAIKIYCLSVGTFIIWQSWGYRKTTEG
jgi:hypothetical protein